MPAVGVISANHVGGCVTTRPPLEKKVEADFLKELKKLPVKVRKMNGMGFNSWPDRLVIGPHGFFYWVELKRAVIGKLSAGQEDLFGEMFAMGHEVHIFTDGKEAALAVKYALIRHGVEV
jgi:hypothetical protein